MYVLLLRRLFTSLAMVSRLRFQRDLCVMADNKYVLEARGEDGLYYISGNPKWRDSFP